VHFAQQAHDLADVQPIADDLASYATPAYVASTISTGHLDTREPDTALRLLSAHLGNWPDGHRASYATALLRHLRATTMNRDYPTATINAPRALRAHAATPTADGENELKQLRNLARDRARGTSEPALTALRRHLETTQPDRRR
jgi:hypothetical protein